MDGSHARSLTDSSGVLRCVGHLSSSVVHYTLKLKSGAITLNATIYYSSHCYTRSRKPEDPVESVLFSEMKRDGSIDERVFCADRWAFSKKLPGILANLESALCYRGSRNEVFYRVDDATATGSRWAICMALDINAHAQELRLSVRSVHQRNNLPADAKLPQQRFFAILRDFYLPRATKYSWLPK